MLLHQIRHLLTQKDIKPITSSGNSLVLLKPKRVVNFNESFMKTKTPNVSLQTSHQLFALQNLQSGIKAPLNKLVPATSLLWAL